MVETRRSPRSPVAHFVRLLAAMLAVSASPAAAPFAIVENAGSASAETTYSATWLQGEREELAFGPLGGAAVADVSDPFSRVRAAQTGYGLNAVSAEGRVGDVALFAHRAGTDMDVTVRNDEASTSDPLIFEYHLNGGELRLFSGGSFDGLGAEVYVSIFTRSPGHTGVLWSWVLTLRGSGGLVTASWYSVDDPLGLGLPAISAITTANDVAMLAIAPFTAVADLGRLSPGETAFVTYRMDAMVDGPGWNNTGGKATLGDPLDLAGNPGSSIAFAGVNLQPVPVAAPEPATTGLAGLGLALLAILRARRSRPQPSP